MNKPNLISITPHVDICSHPCIQILDVVHNNGQWRIINIYHDTCDNMSLQALLDLDIEATTPTLVIGNFNTHSPNRSPPNILRSYWAGRLEEWASTNLLTLANNPGEITCRGTEHERDSMIDRAWYNTAAIQSTMFSNLEVDWDGSLGSDHTMIKVSGHLPAPTSSPKEEMPTGFITDHTRKEAWICSFHNRPPPAALPPTPTSKELEQAAAVLARDIHETNKSVLCKRKRFHPKAAQWWNTACTTAVQKLKEMHGTAAKATAQACLKGVVRAAKHAWAEDHIEKTDIWELTDWRHGHQLNKVPSLQGTVGLVHMHTEVSDVLPQHFFPSNPPAVKDVFDKDPPPLPA